MKVSVWQAQGQDVEELLQMYVVSVTFFLVEFSNTLFKKKKKCVVWNCASLVFRVPNVLGTPQRSQF